MGNTGRAVLRAHLKTLSPPECREQILELWERFPAVRDYFASRFGGDGAEDVLTRAKARISREFSTGTRSPRGDPAVGRAVITELRRSQVLPEARVEIMLFYVEAALEFAITFGDDRAVRSIAKTFEDALEVAQGADLVVGLRPGIDRLVAEYANVGWGLGDHLREVWLQYEPWNENDESDQRA